jgi:hypothetical protein
MDNAQKSLEKYRANRKRRRERNSKRKNLATTNLADFDEASQQRIKEQVLQSTTKSDGDEGTKGQRDECYLRCHLAIEAAKFFEEEQIWWIHIHR